MIIDKYFLRAWIQAYQAAFYFRLHYSIDNAKDMTMT